jgi:alpha-glucosidase
MRSDGTPTGDFTSGEPWLPMGDDVAERNVAKLRADERSLLSLYRRLIHLRRAEPALVAGDYVPIRSRNDILMYQRASGSEELLVALNTVHQPRKVEWQGAGTLLLSTYLDSDGKAMAGSILLRADEGIIVKLQVR